MANCRYTQKENKDVNTWKENKEIVVIKMDIHKTQTRDIVVEKQNIVDKINSSSSAVSTIAR